MGVVIVEDSVITASVAEDWAGDEGNCVAAGMLQRLPEKPSGQRQPRSPVLSSR